MRGTIRNIKKTKGFLPELNTYFLKIRKESDVYKKIVYWSDEDNCFIGMCPELMYGGVHGDDVFEVFRELNEAIEEVIEIYREEGISLPEPKEIVLQTA